MDATFLLECLGVHTVWYIVGSIEHQRMRYQNVIEDVIVSVALVTRFSHPPPHIVRVPDHGGGRRK